MGTNADDELGENGADEAFIEADEHVVRDHTLAQLAARTQLHEEIQEVLVLKQRQRCEDLWIIDKKAEDMWVRWRESRRLDKYFQ